MELKFQVGVQ